MREVDSLGNVLFESKYSEQQIREMLRCWWTKNITSPSYENTRVYNSFIAFKGGIIYICNYMLAYHTLGLPQNILELLGIGNVHNIMQVLIDVNNRINATKDINIKREEMLDEIYEDLYSQKKERKKSWI